MLHTHTHLKDCKLSDQTYEHWIHPHYLRKPALIFVQNNSIGQLSQQSQHHTPSMELHYSNSCQQFSAYIYPFVYQPTCTTLGSPVHATKPTKWMGWIPQASGWPTVTRPLSMLPCVPRSHPWNKHQTPCWPCSKQEMSNQMWYHLHLRATLFHNYAINSAGYVFTEYS